MESFIGRFSRSGKTKKAADHQRDLWAVRDVSFEVMPGESIGIIGRNGSGKSTMLKLITRIIRPTAGRITVRGQLSALLELGAGFHPDLTGRENIFLNASLLGLQEEEIKRHFDSVVSFSELEEFIDMPVKHYSSGMYMRLGFSVAIHVSPNILIVDEILAVGDQKFQEKCLARIQDMQEKGVSIILVSHNIETMRKMCTHLVWLENGRLMANGPTDVVAQQYLELLYEEKPSEAMQQTSDFVRWGTGDMEITGVRFLDQSGQERRTFKTNDQMVVEMAYRAHKPITEPEFGFAIFHRNGAHVNGPNSRLGGLETGVVSGDGLVRYHIERLPLLPGQYRLTAAIHDSVRGMAYDYHKEAYPLEVITGGTKESHGLVEMQAHWEWQPT
jgi:ABC-type polysaccharide/polyol phosphate transport system ATPase subunit